MKYVITRIILDQKLNLTKQSITLELRNEMHHNWGLVVELWTLVARCSISQSPEPSLSLGLNRNQSLS